MDWDSIFVTALACSAGAIAGILLGWLLAPVFGLIGEGARRLGGIVVIFTCIVAGYLFLPTVLAPYVEPRLDAYREGAAETPIAALDEPATPVISDEDVDRAIESAMAGLDDPFLTAVLEREQGRAEQLRSRLGAAYRRGGEEALVAALVDADQDIMQVSFPYYMARAQADDLLNAVRQIRTVIANLADRDPMTCHSWLYGSMTGDAFDFEAYMAAIGRDQHQELQSRMAAVVRGASDILPEYDEIHAASVLDEVRQRMNARLGDEKVGLIIAAQKPESTADARLACEASGAYYDYILADAKAVDVFRHRYSGNEY